MTPWLVVFLKELRDASRDRRALMSLLILPVIGPLMIYYLFNMLIDIGERAASVELPVVGAQYAPDLID
ncbi:MAG: ABC transporter permease, partial [Pseudomonadota bacterium]|nr:ABC transporter permease [Pseudomonadota bacterium]